jgi:hypothetical protein
MAWRIDEFVVRGEIDSRTRGRVTGRLWFADRVEPVAFDLSGNPWRDLAGRLLKFVNPNPRLGLSEFFSVPQAGVIGDCTASRKVKVPDVPLEEMKSYSAQHRPVPWHWGNSIYFEWFSTTNGRIVIESADYRFSISLESTWEMTATEEAAQRRLNREALQRFLERVDAAPPEAGAREAHDGGEPAAEPGSHWSDDRPLGEEEADRLLDDSDRMVDRIKHRLDREGTAADFERIIREEIDRRRREQSDRPLTPGEEAERNAWIEDLNRAADEAASDVEAPARHAHPLATQAYALAERLLDTTTKRGWLPAGVGAEHPVAALLFATMQASGKLAGALNHCDWPPPLEESGLCIAWLKRARLYLDAAFDATNACADLEFTEPAWLTGQQREVVLLREAVDKLIAELRERLTRGWE